MKTKLTITIVFCSFLSNLALGQDFIKTRKFLIDQDNFVRTHEGYIVTSQGLNKYFANKVAYYLSSANDLSLFKNYAILTPSSDNLFIGHNFTRKDNENYRISPFLTLGLNANYAKSIAPIFSDHKFQGGLSLNLKYTWFFKGSIRYGDKKYEFQETKTKGLTMSKKDSMDISRAYILGMIMKTMDDDSTALVKNMKYTSHLTADQKSVILKAKFAALEAGYKESFAKQQADVLDQSALTNSSHFSWISLSADIPFTPTTYSVTPAFSSAFDEKSSYPYSFNILYNNVWENHLGNFFLLTKAGFQNNNTILSKQLNKSSYLQYKSLGGIDTVKAIQLDSKDIYVGKYDNFFNPAVKLQLIYFPKFSAIFGLDFQLDKSFGSYHPLNGTIGIPFRLASSTADKPITFEVQLQMPDLRNEIISGKKFWDKAIIGVTVGLPFGSSVY